MIKRKIYFLLILGIFLLSNISAFGINVNNKYNNIKNAKFLELSYGETIIVPDDYPTIQEAVDNSNNGDTIYVRNGIYYENIIIDKSISLIGEDKNNTKIDSSGNGNNIAIIANYVNINGFTIQNGSIGLMISSNNNSIIENIICNTIEDGINLDYSYGNQISFNYLKDNNDVIELWHSSNDNNISNNHIIDNNVDGISLHSSNFNIISNNIIINCNIGINIEDSNNNQIKENTVSSNKISGINLYNSSINTIIGNTANSNNEIGIILDNNSYNNSVFDCIANDNMIGIAIWNSSYNHLMSSYTANNVFGIILINSSKNEIINNEANNNSLDYESITFIQGPPGAGILFGQSSQNTLIANSCSNNSVGILMFNFYNESRHKPYYNNSIDTSNLVNGKPVYYYYNQKNLIIENLDTSHLTLAFCENSIIRNCNISNGDGISLWSSNNNIIEDSIFSNNALGILLHGTTVFDSVNNIINDCKVYDNYMHGIILNCAHDLITTSTVKNCEISNNGYMGLALQYTSNNNIIGNSFKNNGLFIISENLQNFTHNIENNLVNNKPLLYCLNQQNLVIDGEKIGQIILVNCTDLYLNNLSFSYTDFGILTGFSNYIFIKNVHIANTLLGIYFIESLYNTISDCRLENNSIMGIQVMNSSFFNITSNNIEHNEYGLLFGDTFKSIISKNVFRNNNVGIGFYQSFDNEIYHNNFIKNNQHAGDDSSNIWDNGKYGNYWDDYKIQNPNARDNNRDGVWDTAYMIQGGGENNKDLFPLVNEWPNPHSITILNSRPSITLFLKFFENHPILYQLFQRFLKL